MIVYFHHRFYYVVLITSKLGILSFRAIYYLLDAKNMNKLIAFFL